MAHHGQLVDALATNHQGLPRAVLSYMPQAMYSYPGIAHRMAALLVQAGVDTVRAMNTLGIASALFVWVLLLELARRSSPFAAAVTLALAVWVALRMSALIGGELIGNC